jgi:2-methylcitrate dehydratase
MTSRPILRRDLLKYAAATALAPSVARARDQERTVIEDVARWVVELRYEDLPPNVVARAKRVVFDTLGCALGAIDAAPVRLARQAIALEGGNAQATLVGIGARVACDQAAFLNGMALRYLDYNDYVALGPPHHPSINVAPALSVAEMQRLSGKDMILGFVAGYEVEVRLRDAMAENERQGWDNTSILAQYGSAATAGKLLKLDAKKLGHALAIAGSNANTLGEVRRGAEMTPAKGAAEPMAAKNGVFAALLAREGLEYPLTMLDGKYGFGAVVPGKLNEAVLRNRSGDFQILKSCIKLWPCVGTAQAPIAAALEIRKQQPKADEIAQVTISLSEFAYRQQSAFPEEINTREHADHSVPYLVARALLDGQVLASDFDEKRFRDPPATALIKRTAMRADRSLPDAAIGAKVEAVSRSGARYSASVPIPPGDMSNPPDDAKLSTKFFALADPVLGHARAQTAMDAILSVDAAPNLNALVAALSPAKRG